MTSGKKLFSNHAAVTAVRILCRDFEIGNDLSPPVPLPEHHEHKNRAHIDLDVTDLEAAVQRALAEPSSTKSASTESRGR